MAEIPTLTEYDGRKSKVRCSIQWIFSEAYRDQTIAKNLPQGDIVQVFEPDGGLKKNVSTALCSGDPYCKITSKMFDLIEPLQSHEDVIQILCSKGLYVLDNSDSLITANDLRKMPLMLGAHLTIIDMLMFAYVSRKLVSVNSLVMTVRKFSEMSASKELPDNLEEALMLWLNKISLKVHINHRNSLELDKHTFGQQREDDTQFPSITNLTEDLCDGKSVGLLLHYYCPNHIVLRDISLKEPISIADAWHNLQLSFNFCNDVLLPQNSPSLNVIPPTILHPVDLLYCRREMRLNVIVLLGTLYHYLEAEALQDVVSPLGHSVLCRRRREDSFEDFSNDSKENYQLTLGEASELIPDIQPLISMATRQSFRKTSADPDCVSTITLNESEDSKTRAPFSSKPLLVRRNREAYQTSKPYTRTPVQHLPLTKTSHGQDINDVMPDKGDLTSLSQRSRSCQGLSEESTQLGCPQPIANKWHLRTAPVQDLRNTNTSNNSALNKASDYYYDCPSTEQSTSSRPTYATHTRTSDLFSNVELDNGSELIANPAMLRAEQLSLGPSFEFSSTFNPMEVAENRNRNDMFLESARTSEYNSARAESSATSDLTSVSSKSASKKSSSNEVTSQDFTLSDTYSVINAADIPSFTSADESPELPKNATRVIPHYTSDTGTSSFSAPTSQKSYTVQNGDFHTVNSTRAAGSGDPRRSQPMKAKPIPGQQHEIIIGGTVVKLRTPQRKSNRVSRNAKASSWMDQTEQKVLSRPPDDQRRHSNALNADRIAAAFKKLEERRKFIDTERRTIKERKNHFDQEKKFKQQREWNKEFSAPQQQTNTLDLQRDGFQYEQNRHMASSNQVRKTTSDQDVSKKNEETSSDYSSKSPSPSSMNNNNNINGAESESCVIKQFEKYHRDPAENFDYKTSDYHNLFASPLSRTSHPVPKPRQHKTADNFEGPVPSQRSMQSPVFNQRPRDQTYDVSKGHPPAFTRPCGNRSMQMQHFRSRVSASDITSKLPPNEVSQSQTSARNLLKQKRRLSQKQPNATYEVSARDKSDFHPEKNKQVAQTTPVTVSTTDKTENVVVGSRRMKHDISKQFVDKNSNAPQAFSRVGSVHSSGPSSIGRGQSSPNRPSMVPQMTGQTQEQINTHEISILQQLPSERTAQRSLFPMADAQDPDLSADEQENIDPNHLVSGHADQTSYDSFSCEIAGIGSNQSTPHKMSPTQASDMVTPPKGDIETDMSSILMKAADKDRKGENQLNNLKDVETTDSYTMPFIVAVGKVFELVDEATPNIDVAKRKEQFLLKQLKKEEELKRKRADREKLDEIKKEEARQKLEEIAAKKEEEKLKRQHILEEYKKRKMQQEEAKLIQQSSAVIGGGNGKKHPKQESSPHATKLNKAPRSGRSSPAPDDNAGHVVVNGYHPPGENQSTFIVSAGSDNNSANAVLAGTRNPLPGRKDWETESISSSAVSSEYTGPKLYKQPSSKSNKHIVYNAICHCCLQGKVNEPLRNSTIQVLEMSKEKHFMILFRDAKCQYRALYTYNPDEENLQKMSGNGPHNIVPSMIERLFKYNSGRKSFISLSSKTLSVSIDGITIKNVLWQKKSTSAKK